MWAQARPYAQPMIIEAGYDIADTSGYPEGFEWERVTVVEEWLGCRGVGLLGIQVCDGERWASTGPMHSFESYPLKDDLPRAVVIPGPHPFDSCKCAACAPRRQRRRPGPSTGSV